MKKTLEAKLERLAADSTADEFILADAKDADMAFGTSAPGVDPQTGKVRSIQQYHQLIREIVEQGLIDIALMSASTCEVLAADEGLFASSHVTPAIRANDSTDIWLAAGSADYSNQPSLSFRSAELQHAMHARDDSAPVVDLGLYSITPVNDAQHDRASLAAYAEFRREAQTLGFRHFLEVFPPNVAISELPVELGQFIADTVARLLAGLTRAERPKFLKIPYLGPKWTERLANYDSTVVVGIMGGAAGTSFDTFKLLEDAKKYGVRAALFGRRINGAEDQLSFIQHLRWIADGELQSEEAVHSYHGALQSQGIKPLRSLADDLQPSESSSAASYSK